MLFLDDILEPYRSDIILKLWMSEAWILRFGNHFFFGFKIPGDWKNELFPRGTYNSQNLSNETLAIGDQEYVNDSKFSLFDIKLKLKENNRWHAWMNEFEWMNLNENQKRLKCKSSSLFSHNSVFNKADLEMFLNIRDQQGPEFHFWNFESC